jgi:hypothetical protein
LTIYGLTFQPPLKLNAKHQLPSIHFFLLGCNPLEQHPVKVLLVKGLGEIVVYTSGKTLFAPISIPMGELKAALPVNGSRSPAPWDAIMVMW